MPTEAEIEIVSRRVKGLRAEFDERKIAAKPKAARITPRYLTPLQLAMDAKRRGIPLRPDLARALADHEGMAEK